MRRALLVVLTGLALSTPAVAQDGSLGVRLLGDGPYVVADVQPGDRLERQVEVANSTDGPLDVALYAGAATLDGEAFDFADGRDGNELTGWTTVTPSSATVPAGATTTVDVRVDVPPDARTGARYAVVWAEAADDGGGVRRVSRVGVRLYVTVAEPSLLVPGAVAGALLLLAAGAVVRLRRR